MACFPPRKSFKTEIDEDVEEASNSDDTNSNMLSTLGSLHDLLCTTVSLINTFFSFTIAAYIGLILISLTVSLFGSYDVLFSQDDKEEKIGFSLMLNLWNLYLLCFVILAVSVSSFSTRAAKATIVLLHKALHYQESETVQRRVNKFILYRTNDENY